jgi:hypothetical protein
LLHDFFHAIALGDIAEVLVITETLAAFNSLLVDTTTQRKEKTRASY